MVARVQVEANSQVIRKAVHQLILKAGRPLAAFVIGGGGVASMNRDELFRLMHTLAGLAGNMGAVDIYRDALELAGRLKIAPMFRWRESQ